VLEKGLAPLLAAVRRQDGGRGQDVSRTVLASIGIEMKFKRLVVSPDGDLSVPFELLTDRAGTASETHVSYRRLFLRSRNRRAQAVPSRAARGQHAPVVICRPRRAHCQNVRGAH
jgi:hypothetical protein